mmetsp:Transcript_17198/g.28970  ORF Transcript_17198/g.28970 Transcript_17198/m.28970 type:complete len:164 (+) Transcript_17198:74-565(+)
MGMFLVSSRYITSMLGCFLSFISIGYCFDLIMSLKNPFSFGSHRRQENAVRFAVAMCVVHVMLDAWELSLESLTDMEVISFGSVQLSKSTAFLLKLDDYSSFYFQVVYEVSEVFFLLFCLQVTIQGILLRKGLNRQVRKQIALKSIIFILLRLVTKLIYILIV